MWGSGLPSPLLPPSVTKIRASSGGRHPGGWVVTRLRTKKPSETKEGRAALPLLGNVDNNPSSCFSLCNCVLFGSCCSFSVSETIRLEVLCDTPPSPEPRRRCKVSVRNKSPQSKLLVSIVSSLRSQSEAPERVSAEGTKAAAVRVPPVIKKKMSPDLILHTLYVNVSTYHRHFLFTKREPSDSKVTR